MGHCNLVAILSIADMVYRNCGIHEVLGLYSTGMVCLSYVVKLIAAEHGRYGLSFSL